MRINKNVIGAGIMCYYDNRDSSIIELENDILFLCLIDYENLYDIPKGTLDTDETFLNCAVRETYEESGLEYTDFVEISDDYNYFGNSMVVFLGELNSKVLIDKSIYIKPNPKTKIIEHKSFKFLSLKNILKKTPDYLKEAFVYYDNFIRDNNV